MALEDKLQKDFQRLLDAFHDIEAKKREEIIEILGDLGRDLDALFGRYAPFLNWGVCYRLLLQRLQKGAPRGRRRAVSRRRRSPRTRR
jgi:hypothetical protein